MEVSFFKGWMLSFLRSRVAGIFFQDIEFFFVEPCSYFCTCTSIGDVGSRLSGQRAVSLILYELVHLPGCRVLTSGFVKTSTFVLNDLLANDYK